MSGYRLTIRHGARIERERFEGLDEAIASLERHAEEVRAAGPLDGVSALRRFEPEQRVAARLELSTGSFLRRRDAGLDVMGDGTLVPYAGGVRRRPLKPDERDSPFDAVRGALR